MDIHQYIYHHLFNLVYILILHISYYINIHFHEDNILYNHIYLYICNQYHNLLYNIHLHILINNTFLINNYNNLYSNGQYIHMVHSYSYSIIVLLDILLQKYIFLLHQHSRIIHFQLLYTLYNQ